MSRLGEAAAISAKGSFITFVGSSLSLLLSAGGGILVARLLSPSDFGLFGVALIAPGLFSLFSDWGISSALTRFTARYRSEGRHREARELVRGGFVFKLALGGALSVALFLSADWAAAVLIRRPEAGGLLRMISPLILSQSIFSTVLSVLAGSEMMDRRAVVVLSQAAVKGFCSPLLVYLGLGVSGAVMGYVLSYAVAASIGLLLTFSSVRGGDMPSRDASTFTDGMSLMLGFGFPLFLGSLIGGLIGQLQGLLVAWFVSNEEIGNYNVSLRFLSLVGLVTGSIGVTLFPAFSKFSYVDEPVKAREAFRGSVRYSTMMVTPFAALLAVLSGPIVYTLFTDQYPQAPVFSSLLMIPMLLVGMGFLSIDSFINSQGDTETNFKLGLAVNLLSLLHFPVLIWIWGIRGLLVSGIVSGLTGNLLGLYVVRRKYGVRLDLPHMGKTLICSAVSAGLAYGAAGLLPSSMHLLNLFMGSAVFVAAYVVIAPFTGAVEELDIENLDRVIRELKIVYPLVRPLLILEETIIAHTRKRKEI